MKIRPSDNFWKTNQEKTIFSFLIFLYLVAPGLSCGTQGLYLQHAGSSSLTRGWTWDPGIGMQSLSHWTTREVPREDCVDLMGRTVPHPEILAFHREAEPNGTLPQLRSGEALYREKVHRYLTSWRNWLQQRLLMTDASLMYYNRYISISTFKPASCLMGKHKKHSMKASNQTRMSTTVHAC